MHKIASYKSFNIIRAIFLGVTQSASKLPVYQPSVISSHLFFQNLNLWTTFIFQVCRFTRLEHLRLQAATAALLTKYIFSFSIWFLWFFFISGSQGNAMWARGTALPVSVLISGNGNKIFHIWGCQQDFSGNVNKISHPWRCQQDFSSPEMPTRKPKVCCDVMGPKTWNQKTIMYICAASILFWINDFKCQD